MPAPTITHDAGEPLFDADQTVEPDPGKDTQEIHFADDNGVSRGQRRFIVLDGVVITRRRHTIFRDFELMNEQEIPTVNLRFCLQGEVNTRLSDAGREARTREGNHNIWYTPERETTHAIHENDAHDVVEVFLTQEYVASLAKRHPRLLEGALAPIVRQEPFQLREEGMAVTPRMKSVIRQILSSEEQGALRQMFIEAKVTELLVLELQQHEERAEQPQAAVDLSKRDIDRMHEARDRMLACMDDPPTLPELARQVGTNEFTLKRQFKAVFGNTVFGLLRDHKMDHARTLLLDTDRLVGDIAREVGYNHPANFSAAFKKQHGVSPSTFRKGD